MNTILPDYRKKPRKRLNSVWVILSFGILALTAGMGAEPVQWGVNGHPLTQEGYLDLPVGAQLDLVSELGAGWYRFDFNEKNVARCEELVAEAERRKIHLLPILDSSPGGRTEDAPPEQIRAAAFAFAKGVVGRFKGKITHWELSNELDEPAMIRKGEKTRSGKLWEWDAPDGSSPDDYEESRYQKARAEIQGLHEGVKAADPGALTIVDTAGWLHYGFIERLVNEDKAAFDILSWHWYSEMGDLSAVQGKLDLVALLKRYGKPLWLTEINRRDGSKHGKEMDQAQYMSKNVAKIAATPGIAALFIYELLDEPYFGEGESNYGLVEIVRDKHGKWQVSRKKQGFEACKTVIASGH